MLARDRGASERLPHTTEAEVLSQKARWTPTIEGGIIALMTNAVRQLIDSFEALPEQEKHEVLAQLLQRLIGFPYSSLSDDELTHVADFVFQGYDRDEAQG